MFDLFGDWEHRVSADGYLCEGLFSVLLGVYPGVEWPGHLLILHLTSEALPPHLPPQVFLFSLEVLGSLEVVASTLAEQP